MIISMVVAVSENNAIGKDNALLWKLPIDLKHFKNITNGHTVIMGRKTYDSMGKPLPNRRNIVITRTADLEIQGAEVVNTLDDAFELCKSEAEIFVIGGAEIYKQSLSVADRIYLTRVHHNFEADTFFPVIDSRIWRETESERHESDEKHAFAFTFSTLLNNSKA
jgi:dihydrofolate reductase